MKQQIPVPVFQHPSLGDACPRSSCGLKMSTAKVEDFEIVRCSCGYSCKQISGEMKLAYRTQVFERTAQRRSE